MISRIAVPKIATIHSKQSKLNLLLCIFIGLILSSCWQPTSNQSGNQTPLSSSSQPPTDAAGLEEPVVVFKSVTQLTDVASTDQVYQALENLIDRYGIAVAYGDTTFKADKGLTRYELAMTLGSTADQSTAIANLAFAPYATQEQLLIIKRFSEEVAAEIAVVTKQLDILEAERAARRLSGSLSDPTINTCAATSASHLITSHLIASKPNPALPRSQILSSNASIQSNIQIASTDTTTPPSPAGVSTITQIPDVLPTDWAYQAIQSLVERYGIGDALVYPDGTFKGNQVLNRSKFAVALSAALERIIELQQTLSVDIATKSEVILLAASLQDMATELENLKVRLKDLRQETSTSSLQKLDAAQNARHGVLRAFYRSCNQFPQLAFSKDANLDSAPRLIALNQVNSNPERQSELLLAQVTSTSQIIDVPNNHWAYEAIRTMVEKFGALTTYPDRTFRGNNQVSRYEFAAVLNATLDQVVELIGSSSAELASKQDLESLQAIYTEASVMLSTLEQRLMGFENEDSSSRL
ncbi:S-layer homology domain-containing protein [Leptolyngbya sp. NK1-12]|uniref:S-layer homology domain-containing protein n=1 Tax=Leptolyngbya sp. NK1-12 TaxID=2547451 RepID=A0AA97AG24_9CYAN|nr:S-layer homology domain-containing protein [Leptolyngbya sp. NK1-12]